MVQRWKNFGLVHALVICAAVTAFFFTTQVAGAWISPSPVVDLYTMLSPLVLKAIAFLCVTYLFSQHLRHKRWGWIAGLSSATVLIGFVTPPVIKALTPIQVHLHQGAGDCATAMAASLSGALGCLFYGATVWLLILIGTAWIPIILGDLFARMLARVTRPR